MQIKDLKELKKFISLCRETGITDVKVDGMEFHLGVVAPKPVRAPRRLPLADAPDALKDAKITVPQFSLDQKPDETPEQAREKYNKRKAKQKNVVQQEVDEAVATPTAFDELTEEEKLFYSANGGDPQ